jgi:hypothetical protein
LHADTRVPLIANASAIIVLRIIVPAPLSWGRVFS